MERSLRMDISSLIKILKVLIEEKENVVSALISDPLLENYEIMSISGIGPVTGSVMLGEISDINILENAEKLVAFAGIDHIKRESRDPRSPYQREAIHHSDQQHTRALLQQGERIRSYQNSITARYMEECRRRRHALQHISDLQQRHFKERNQ